MAAHINDTIDVWNEVASLKAELLSEEVQRIIKIPAAYANAVDKFTTKRTALVTAIQGINDLLQGKATELYHKAFEAYDKTTAKPATPEPADSPLSDPPDSPSSPKVFLHEILHLTDTDEQGGFTDVERQGDGEPPSKKPKLMAEDH